MPVAARTFDGPGYRLNYSVEGAGPAVTLVHGVGANLASWDAVCRRLAPRMTVVRLDLRGHGRSSPICEAFSLREFAADVIAVLDAEGIERTHLAGFSLGGLIAQYLALEWPQRLERVAILSAVAGRTPEERERVLSRLDMIRKGGIAAVAGASRERWFTDEFARTNPEVIEARIAELVANDLDSYLEAYRVFGESELADRLHEIRHETLIMTGENDIGSNTRMARLMHERIERSDLVILPRLKHSVLLEAPDEIADRLLSFLLGERQTDSLDPVVA